MPIKTMRVGWCSAAILLLLILPIIVGKLPSEELEDVRRSMHVWNVELAKSVRKETSESMAVDSVEAKNKTEIVSAAPESKKKVTDVDMSMKLSAGKMNKTTVVEKAHKYNLLECSSCKSSESCETGLCYFGRCVSNTPARMEHSIKLCFLGFDAAVIAKKKEECAPCKKPADCHSGLCYHHKCIYGGAIKHLSILTCFDDSYIESCKRPKTHTLTKVKSSA